MPSYSFRSVVVLLFIFSISFYWGLPVHAQELSLKDSILIGHNVTPTTDTPPAGIWNIGNYAFGYGLTENLFVATSPWIWASYNTANLHVKWVKDVSAGSRAGLFLSYFHSFNSSPFLQNASGSYLNDRPCGGSGGRPGGGPGGGGNNPPCSTTSTTDESLYFSLSRYQWQSASVHALFSTENSAGVTFYYNLHYAYFWDDEFPYSIRMDPGTDSIRDQVDLTMLTKIPASDDFNWLVEVGGLGLNYLYPYLQAGLSLAYQGDSWLIQLGASYTARFSELGDSEAWRPGRYDTRQHYSDSEGKYYYYRYLQTALHPEIQIQYSF